MGSGSTGNSPLNNSGIGGSSSDLNNSSSSSNLGVFAANEAGVPDPESLNEAMPGSSLSGLGKIKIIADEPNNSVIIVASAQDYEVILPVITQLDVMPLQVLIDATVVEVKLTNKLSYGISWYLSHGGESMGIGSDIASAAAAASTGGLSALYSSGAVKALLNSLASTDNLNVISSPSLMVLNNQKAKINVGQQVPIQTGTTTMGVSSNTGLLPSSNTAGVAIGSSIQYKDTGVTLEVTPRVNANGVVIMKLKQIVSNVASAPSTGVTTSATFDKKEIDSSIAVHDNETIVLGGLIADDVTNGKTGIPFLSNLPLLGSLFGSTSKSNIKTELVVLITPRVVKSKQDSRFISNEFKRKLTGIYQEEVHVNGSKSVK